MRPPQLTVIVPTFDTCAMTLTCCRTALEALLAAPAGAELIVVDDASSDDTVDRLHRELPDVQVIRRGTNGGYSAAVNSGLREARGELLLLLNSDALLDAQSIATLVRAFQDDDQLGVAGPQLLDGSGLPQWSGGRFPTLTWMIGVVSGLGPIWGRIKPRPSKPPEPAVDWICGAVMVFRRDVLEVTGGFDEGVRGYCQDLDFCVRARAAGWQVRIIGAASVTHAGGATLAPIGPQRHDPARLWPDLLEWGERQYGPIWTAFARPVLVACGWARVAVRVACGLGRSQITNSLREGTRQLARAGTPFRGNNPEPLFLATTRAIPYLAARQFVAQALNLISGVVLARLLSPEDFGLFAVVISAHALIAAAVGTGLAAGLVRELEEPGRETQEAAFTFAGTAGALVASLLWIIGPEFLRVCEVSGDHLPTIRLLAAVALLLPWQTVPMALLERRLDYRNIAFVELSQAVVFHGVMLALVVLGARLPGLALALIMRAITGAMLASWLCPWRPAVRWRGDAARHMRRFGTLFQSATIVNLIKDSTTPIMVGLLAGSEAVGQVAWAQMVAGLPTLATGALQRVLFPLFARVRSRPAQLRVLLEGSIGVMHLVAAPLAVLSVVLIDLLVSRVFGPQWQPAVPIFVLLWVASLWSPTVPPLLAVLNALGQPQLALRTSVAWAVGTVVLGTPLIWWRGAMGFAVAMLGVQAINAWLVMSVRKQVEFGWARAMLPAWAVAAVTAGSVALARQAVDANGILALVGWTLCGLAIYVSLVATIGFRRIIGIDTPNDFP